MTGTGDWGDYSSFTFDFGGMAGDACADCTGYYADATAATFLSAWESLGDAFHGLPGLETVAFDGLFGLFDHGGALDVLAGHDFSGTPLSDAAW